MSNEPNNHVEKNVAIPERDPQSAVVVSATFVAEPLEAPLSWIFAECGLRHTIRFAPYNQVFQQLLTPNSQLAGNPGGVNVLLLRLEDFVRDQHNIIDAKITVARITTELCDAIEQLTKRVATTLIVAVMGPGPHVHPDIRTTLTGESREISNRMGSLKNVHVIDEAAINGADGIVHYDSVRDQLAHIPYTDAYFACLALALSRKIHALQMPAAKVLVLDCDNTLWRGVVGEDGAAGIIVSEPYAELQNFAVKQLKKGILICLVSKNTETDVIEVFTTRSDMRLQLDHIVAHRINWLPKPTNIRALANDLNLGLDAFVFMDDNPVECAQMRAELPEVITIQVPAEGEITRMLENLWVFDQVFTTSEDSNRTRMYRENSARRAMESTAKNIDDFIAALNLKIDILMPSEEEWPRVEQLAQRTNQFNFTTRRRTAAELKLMIASGGHVFRVRVSDRFGDYGLVGEIVTLVEGKSLVVDTLLLSCRVLGRGVEHAMLRHLGKLAGSLNLMEVALPYVPSIRNVPARAFAEDVASQFAEPSPDGTIYRIPANEASRIAHSPGHDPIEVVKASVVEEKNGTPAPYWDASDRSDRYARLANVLFSGAAVLDAMSVRRRRPRPFAGPTASPASSLEAQMLLLWQELLEIDGLGVEDDYFALGGTSLLSVKLFAEILRRFGTQLRLTTIIEAPTVRSLTLRVSASTDYERSGLICLRQGGPSNLFLVHDGFGETLLYLNLAKVLPKTMSIYGIEPRRLPGIPLAHASIEDMALFYVEQIRSVQASGPYFLGGMCAGGVIAYAMAACLQRQGDQVQLVTILDGATPQASKRGSRMTRHRLSRLEEAVSFAGSSADTKLSRWAIIAAAILRKVFNVIVYEIESAGGRLSARVRFLILMNLVRRNAKWPDKLPELSVMQIYNMLESRYTPPAIANVPILLVRASVGDGNDTPYRELYQDEDFGWRQVAGRLDVTDVDGGHSSMLQERIVESLAATLVKHLGAGSLSHLSE